MVLPVRNELTTAQLGWRTKTQAIEGLADFVGSFSISPDGWRDR
jgi:hypothetical protein